MIFDVAPADAHAVAAAALKAADAHVPRACLLRRVVADYAARPCFQPALAAGGLRGDRLSVWALQVSTLLRGSLQSLMSCLEHLRHSTAQRPVMAAQCCSVPMLLASEKLLGNYALRLGFSCQAIYQRGRTWADRCMWMV